MKNFYLVFLSLLLTGVSFAKSDNNRKYSISCFVSYVVDEKIPGQEPHGVIEHFKPKRTEYKYHLDDADVYLICGQDTIAHKKSFDGEVEFKKLNPGEYELLYKKVGFKSYTEKRSIVDKSIISFGDLRAVEN